MPKLPRIKASEIISALERLGFVQVRQRGSHVILKKQVVSESKEQKVIQVGCVVPMHRKTTDNYLRGRMAKTNNPQGQWLKAEDWVSK